MASSPMGEVLKALRARKIKALGTPTLPGFAVSVSMLVFDLERFLDIIVIRPLNEDDRLAFKVLGGSSDMVVGEREWHFELIPGIEEAGFEFRVIVNIPDDDLVEVLYRLRDFDPGDAT